MASKRKKQHTIIFFIVASFLYAFLNPNRILADVNGALSTVVGFSLLLALADAVNSKKSLGQTARDYLVSLVLVLVVVLLFETLFKWIGI